MRRIALTLFFALGFLFFVGCDVYRQIPVQYNSPTVVSKEPSIIVSKDPSISVSTLQWNYLKPQLFVKLCLRNLSVILLPWNRRR